MRSSTRIGWSSIPNFDLLPGRFASAYADSICIAFDPKNEMNIQSFVRFVLSNVKLWLFRILETSIVHFYFTVFEATNFETVYVSSLWHYSIHLGPSIVTWRSHPLIIFSQNLRFLFFFLFWFESEKFVTTYLQKIHPWKEWIDETQKDSIDWDAYYTDNSEVDETPMLFYQPRIEYTSRLLLIENIKFAVDYYLRAHLLHRRRL